MTVADEIVLTIDGRKVTVAPGTTILQAARQAGIEVPVLCYFEHTTSNGLCRLCVVEVEGVKGLQASCVAAVRSGAVVHTHSPNVERARRTILEMLSSTVDLSESPELQRMLGTFAAHPERFDGGRERCPSLIDDNPVYIRDYAKCVLCWRCVQVCAEDAQYTYAINFSGRGFFTRIGTFYDRPMTATTCVFCGQCVGVCPTGALKAKREFLFEQGLSPEQILDQTLQGGKGKKSRVGPHLDAEGGGHADG
jgi:NADH dehydrogenase/NADH:ubiquinone oxidoreductase subunit G